MFIGHFALGFAAKRVVPSTSLGTLFLAPELADILWPGFVLLGWEQVSFVPESDPFLRLSFDSFPISHSLLALIGWGIGFALLYRIRAGYARGALVVALLVVSHWLLDFVTHRPDMSLYPGGAKLGLELWRSVPGTIIVEGGMFVAGVAIYAATTRPRDAAGRYALWALVVLLASLYVGSVLGPPPPTRAALATGAVVGGSLLVLLGAWVDRHRESALSPVAPH